MPSPIIDAAKKAVRNVKTESAARNTVQRVLGAHGYRKLPKVEQTRDARGATVRVYAWRGVPGGDVVLVAGPSMISAVHAWDDLVAPEDASDFAVATEPAPLPKSAGEAMRRAADRGARSADPDAARRVAQARKQQAKKRQEASAQAARAKAAQDARKAKAAQEKQARELAAEAAEAARQERQKAQAAERKKIEAEKRRLVKEKREAEAAARKAERDAKKAEADARKAKAQAKRAKTTTKQADKAAADVGGDLSADQFASMLMGALGVTSADLQEKS